MSVRCASQIRRKHSSKGRVEGTIASVLDKERVDEGRNEGWIARVIEKIRRRVRVRLIELRRAHRSAVYRVGTVFEGEAKVKLSGKGGYCGTQCWDASYVGCGQCCESRLAADCSQRQSDTQAVQCMSSSYE